MTTQTETTKTEAPAAAGEAFSTMVVRIWQEPDHEDGFRARLFFTAPGGQPLVGATSSPEGVLDLARAWLLGLQACGVPPQQPGG
jgi:hypothetical protein